MNIVILGAGLAGVTAAWELAKDGHAVTVVDRQPAPARETSFANAGLVAPGHALAWASPKAPGILWRSLFRDDQALRFKLRLDPEMWAWSWRFYRNCNAEAASRNTRRKAALCRFAQTVLHETLAETGIECDYRRDGLLYLHRSAAALDAADKAMDVMRELGAELRLLDAEGCARVDPALAPVKDRIAGGLYAPSDTSGDARKFAEGLAEKCRARGVRFAFETTARGFEAEGGRVAALATDKGRLAADAFVLAAGSYVAALARPLGLKLPVYPIKGYSLTVPIGRRPPRVGGVDEHYLFAYCPMGDRLRLTCTAEFAGYDTGHRPEDFRVMLAAAREILPEGGDYDRPEYWACLRPMTPEGTPLVGRTPVANLFLDIGLGHMGWTMASGTARLVAEIVGGRKPSHDLDGLTLAGAA